MTNRLNGKNIDTHAPYREKTRTRKTEMAEGAEEEEGVISEWMYRLQVQYSVGGLFMHINMKPLRNLVETVGYNNANLRIQDRECDHRKTYLRLTVDVIVYWYQHKVQLMSINLS